MKRALLIAILLCAPLVQAQAEGSPQTFLSEQEFLELAFGDASVPAKMLWLSADLRAQVEKALDEPLGLRLKHWQANGRTAWVLNRVGKDHPITSGFIVDDSGLVDVRVLVYRESRGWEVKHGFFTDQFRGAGLKNNGRLNQSVNNITGATLSVRAMKRMARAALLLHQHVSTSP